jgi:hypothetical protein
MPSAPATRRAQQARISRESSQSDRDIGRVPDIANVRRRSRCRGSLRLFCQTYNPAAFSLAWGPDHLTAIARIEESATLGALFAFAMARGSGKTALCRMAALWAIAYAHCRYAFVIGATDDKAKDTLDSLRRMIRFLPEFAADFPEISFPAVKLNGIAHRAAGQLSEERSTLVEWSADRIVCATVRPPENWPRSWAKRSDGMVPTAGAIVSASGLTGEGIRGSLKTLSTGEMVRPDFVLLDDPQTPESSRSPTQNENRLRLISADVLGMAGPGKAIAAVMPCTVIERGDMVDQVLDRKRHPLWRGERSGMLRSMPTNLDKWREYFAVYAGCAQLEPPDFAASNEHYAANREALDAGAEASWEARKEDWEVSAIQSAMHLYFRDRRGFMAEYQNAPEAADLGAGAKRLAPAAVAARLSGLARFTVPRECSRVTAMIDTSKAVLWYAAVAWDDQFGGSVVDYGCHPRQDRAVFAEADARPALGDEYPGGEQVALWAGLTALAAELFGRSFPREGGGELPVERLLIDSGWETKTVYRWVRQSAYRGMVYPSRGVARTLTKRPLSEWTRREGEQVGHHWRLTPDVQERVRSVQYDTDAWKSFVYERLSVPMGGRACLTLFGGAADGHPPDHELIGHHCAAEYAHPEAVGGVRFDKWRELPGAHENHLWDVLVGCRRRGERAGPGVPRGGVAAGPGRPPAAAEAVGDSGPEAGGGECMTDTERGLLKAICRPGRRHCRGWCTPTGWRVTPCRRSRTGPSSSGSGAS